MSTGLPGQRAETTAQEREILWGSPQERQVLRGSGVLDSAAVDAGNTPTTTLRRGLLLGKVTASGKLKQYDADASDGTETVHSILDHDVSTLENGVATDQHVRVLVSAPVKASQLLIKGAAFIGHTNVAAATTTLKTKFFAIDTELL